MAQTQPQSSARGDHSRPGGPQGPEVGVGPRILRIGIVQGGRVVEERLVRKRGDITIGQSAKNTFVVPASSVLPRSFTLFQLSGNTYAINFTEGMDGRVAAEHNAAPQTLTQLRARAQKRGDGFHLVLPDKSRGKVVIGDTTVLFQFVTPPPVQPRPQLPPSVRGNIWQNLDWVMIAIVAISLFSHGGFVAYLRSVDWPRKPDIEEIPDRFVQMIVPKKIEEKKIEKVDPNANAEKKDDAKKDDKPKKLADSGDKAKKPEVSAEEKARREAERRARLAEQVSSMGALKLLGSKGDGGTLADMLKSGDPGGDADRVFGQIGGVGVAGNGGGLRGARGAGGTGTAQGIEGLRAAGPGEVGTGDRGTERVATMRGSIRDAAPEAMDGELDPNVVANEIRRRKGAIIACYERALKRNPNLQGKLKLAFTVSSVGKVTSAEIEEDKLGDDEVNSCITTIVRTWRFPAPSGGEVHFSYPFFFTASK